MEEYLTYGCLKDVDIIDHHLHCGAAAQFYGRGDDFSLVPEDMRRLNIRIGIISDINVYGDGYEYNRNAEKWAAQYPDLLKCAIVINANYTLNYKDEI